tara:strand:- start:32 stop:217 length:186 start_codon:yes stop_codon:yes gene_type:complete
MKKNNFIDLETGKEVYISRFRTCIKLGKVVYKNIQGQTLNIEKINNKLNKLGVRTDTKNRI